MHKVYFYFVALEKEEKTMDENSAFDDDLQNILEAMRILARLQSRQARKTEQLEKKLSEFLAETEQRLDILEKKSIDF
jgi:hypothetical protein